MSNVLKAIRNIVDNPVVSVTDFYKGRNRANSVGAAFEAYVQDVFADSFDLGKQERILRNSEVFSYLGNQNNPPDLILKNGDAIETKKVQNAKSALALNSSYPKSKLYADSPMLTNACKTCEDWVEKDIIYVVGHTTDDSLKSIWLVYGDCFAADQSVYERIRTTISDGIMEISDVEFTKTKELGKVKKVDPLGVTDLRIRGMWHIENPHKIFSYLYTENEDADFKMFCLMRVEKFNSFPEEDKIYILELGTSGTIQFENVVIHDPDNPAKKVDCVFIRFEG